METMTIFVYFFNWAKLSMYMPPHLLKCPHIYLYAPTFTYMFSHLLIHLDNYIHIRPPIYSYDPTFVYTSFFKIDHW